MSLVVVTVCFRELLRDVCQRFSLAMPMYGIPVENDEGLVSVFVDIELVGGDVAAQPVRCWSLPCADVDQAEEDAARRSVARLHDEFLFEVKDYNLEDKKFFENLYDRLFLDHSALGRKYKRLKGNYKLLRGYYNELLAEKERYAAEREEIKKKVASCAEVLNRPLSAPVAENSNSGNTVAYPVAPAVGDSVAPSVGHPVGFGN